jgi:hypothetical protein
MPRDAASLWVAGRGGRKLPLRWFASGAVCVLVFAVAVAAQDPPADSQGDEVPLERCDRLPVVRVLVDGVPMRFLVDTAATSFLNQKSVAGGRRADVGVSSWTGETRTTAREVRLKEFTLGNQTLHGLKIPAIELGRIEKACGGRIDGVIGVDLLERFGATIDLQKQVAIVAGRGGGPATEQELLEGVRACMENFNRADWERFGSCVDPEIVWVVGDREIYGRHDLLEYLASCGSEVCAHAPPRVTVQRFWIAGNVAWFEYAYRVSGIEEEFRGMGIVHRVGGGWLLVNIHNSRPGTLRVP